VARLAYEASVRALEDQERELEQLRTRAGVVLATSAVAASFLGSSLTNSNSVLAGLALVAFVVVIGACVYVLTPKEKLVFSLSGQVLYESLEAIDHDETEVHRRLAYWLEGFWQDNDSKIDTVNKYFTAAGGALLVEVVLGVAAVRGTIG
jgi:hypothetical protein